MELLKTLFENADLPTEFKEKTETLFEAAVTDRVKAELVALQESYEAQAEANKLAFITEATATVDSVVEATILEWAKENAVALDSQIKGQIAESFLSGLKGIFEKADIELNGTDTAAKELTKLQEQNATLLKESTETLASLKEAQEKLTQLKVKEIIESLTDGLADTVAHRVAKLCEAFEFKTEDDFRAKASMVLEAVTGGVKATIDTDGTQVPVDSTKDLGSKVDTASGASGPESGEAVTKPAGTKNTSAEGDKAIPKKVPMDPLKEQYDANRDQYAPHLDADMVKETLKLFK